MGVINVYVILIQIDRLLVLLIENINMLLITHNFKIKIIDDEYEGFVTMALPYNEDE